MKLQWLHPRRSLPALVQDCGSWLMQTRVFRPCLDVRADRVPNNWSATIKRLPASVWFLSRKPTAMDPVSSAPSKKNPCIKFLFDLDGLTPHLPSKRNHRENQLARFGLPFRTYPASLLKPSASSSSLPLHAILPHKVRQAPHTPLSISGDVLVSACKACCGQVFGD